MSQSTNPTEDKLRQYALAVREFGKTLPMTVANVEDLKSLVRASGSVGEHFIAAGGATHRQAYLVELQKCITEARSTHYWLGLVDSQGQPEIESRREQLMSLTGELIKVVIQLMEQSKS